MSTPTVGLSRISSAGLASPSTWQHDALLVAARKRLHWRCPGSETLIARSSIQCRDRLLARRVARSGRSRGELVENGDEDVGRRSAARAPGPSVQPVLRTHRRCPRRSACALRLERERLAGEADLARRRAGSCRRATSASSVRPEPSRPVRPTISPAWMSKETSSYSPGRVRFRTDSTTGACVNSTAAVS